MTRVFLGVLIALFVLVAGPGPARAAIFDPQTARLANGLEVIVVTSRRAPVVSHMVWYKVGSIDEPQGLSGIAHFLEHLMFKGTPTVPAGEFSKTVSRNGGQDNAFTSYDYTGYYQSIAADRLELVMKLEADRMRNLILDPAEIETERAVVLEERRSRVESTPGARLSEQASAAFYLHHPYGRPIIGWEHEINAITPDDLRAFYDRWYGPNNAVLVVVGDVSMDDVLPLAEKYYGAIPAREIAPPLKWIEPEHRAERTISLADPDVTQPSWSKRFIAPGYLYGATEHAYPLQVLSQIIGGGATSRLYNALVIEQKVASSAGAWYGPDNRGPSTFGFYVSPANGKPLDAAVAAMEAEVEKLRRDGVTQDEVDRAIVRLTDAAEYAKDSFEGIARTLGSAAVIGRSPADVEAWPASIAAVTLEQVNAALEYVLAGRGALTTRLLPAETDDKTEG